MMVGTVLRRLQSMECVHSYISGGTTFYVNFIVMTLHGPKLDELLLARPKKIFTSSTSLRLGVQILSAIRCIHNIGFLHRLVCPSSFSMGGHPEIARCVYMAEFELARKYTNAEGNVRPARPNAEFRGSLRFASINAHKNKVKL